MMTLARILFGLGAYVVLAFAIGKNLRAVSRHYPAAETVAHRAPNLNSAPVSLPVTLPQRGPGILVHAMNS